MTKSSDHEIKDLKAFFGILEHDQKLGPLREWVFHRECTPLSAKREVRDAF